MEESEKREPKYALLVQHLTELIEEISVQEDTCLPSERELCERYGVSRITVRRALSELESAEQIYRVQGKGAFVRSQKTQFFDFSIEGRRKDGCCYRSGGN